MVKTLIKITNQLKIECLKTDYISPKQFVAHFCRHTDTNRMNHCCHVIISYLFDNRDLKVDKCFFEQLCCKLLSLKKNLLLFYVNVEFRKQSFQTSF